MRRTVLFIMGLVVAGCITNEPPPQVTPELSDVKVYLHDPDYALEDKVLTVSEDDIIRARLKIGDLPDPTDQEIEVISTFQTPSHETLELVFEGHPFQSPLVEVIYVEKKDPLVLGEFTFADERKRLSKKVASDQLNGIGTPISTLKVGGIPLDAGDYQSAIAVVWVCSKDPYYAQVVRELVRKTPAQSVSPKEAIVAILQAEQDYQDEVGEDALQPQE